VLHLRNLWNPKLREFALPRLVEVPFNHDLIVGLLEHIFLDSISSILASKMPILVFDLRVRGTGREAQDAIRRNCLSLWKERTEEKIYGQYHNVLDIHEICLLNKL
jgi:hypothetical protein